jgi:glycosyltransferase involved in cell wall biosynthesis
MRILFVTTGMLTGGAEIQIAGLASELAAQGHHIALLNLTGQAEVTLPPEVTLFNLDMRPQGLIRGLWIARQYINQWKPDVVHSHMIKANLFARMLRPISRIPRLICTAHSIHEGSVLMMMLYRLTDHFCNLTTHVSKEAIDHFISAGAVPAGKIAFMPNGININKFDPMRPHREKLRQKLNKNSAIFLWLHVGRMVPEKAQESLIQAFSYVKLKAPHAQLWIVGDGPMLKQHASLIADLKLEESITLLGKRTDVPALMQAADGFVLSSRIEGSPLVLGEAMASGLPTVSTRVSGAAQLLSPEDILVPVGDLEKLAEAMLLTIATTVSDTQRNSRRSHIQSKFSMPYIAAQWVDIYQSKS